MASVQSGYKQSKGYFVVTNATGFTAYNYSGGGGAGGNFVPGTMTAVTPPVVIGSVLRDMGKTVLVGSVVNGTGSGVNLAGNVVPVAGQNQRVFRKVQWVFNGSAVGPTSNGVGGAPDNGVFYIELPNLQGGGLNENVATAVSYVPAMPGL